MKNRAETVFCLLFSGETITHLTKVPCNMRLDISAGDTSMNRKKEKQLPLSLPDTIKTKMANITKKNN